MPRGCPGPGSGCGHPGRRGPGRGAHHLDHRGAHDLRAGRRLPRPGQGRRSAPRGRLSVASCPLRPRRCPWRTPTTTCCWASCHQRERGHADPFGDFWLPQLRAGGVVLQVLPVYTEEQHVGEGALRRALLVLETARWLADLHRADVAIVETGAELRARGGRRPHRAGAGVRRAGAHRLRPGVARRLLAARRAHRLAHLEPPHHAGRRSRRERHAGTPDPHRRRRR